jgi:hypothetical protein
MSTNYYWFNPETSTFYGPSTISHENVIYNNPELCYFDKNLLIIPNILTNKDWVRLYFNNTNNELGISCYENKFALKTVRNFVKNESFVIESLFLDVKPVQNS